MSKNKSKIWQPATIFSRVFYLARNFPAKLAKWWFARWRHGYPRWGVSRRTTSETSKPTLDADVLLWSSYCAYSYASLLQLQLNMEPLDYIDPIV